MKEYMRFFNKFFWKAALGFLVIIAASVAVLLWLGNSESEDFKNQERMARELEEKYKNDTYGGDTPEQTLQLFIDALKAGDTELASKYFVIEKQEEWKEDLENVKKSGTLNNMINDLLHAKKTKSEEYKTLFVITNEKSVVTSLISIFKIPNGKWKIESL